MAQELDFDEASRAWRANKKRMGQMFVYICTYIHSNGKRCRRTIENCVPANPYQVMSAWQCETAESDDEKSNVFCKQHKRRCVRDHFSWV